MRFQFLNSYRLLLVIALMTLSSLCVNAVTHVILVRDASMEFIPQYEDPILLGDTIHWLPMDTPLMFHTITSTTIPEGAASFDEQWFAPDNLFFEYVPTEIGQYDYVCLPHQAMGMVGSFIVEAPLSVGETELVDISVFPNPAANEITIQSASDYDVYRMYNIAGELVQSGRNNGNTIPVHGLERGVYFIELQGASKRLHKFVKN